MALVIMATSGKRTLFNLNPLIKLDDYYLRLAGSAEVEGIIAEIFVEEGSNVQKGDLIARLSDRDYRSEVTKLKADIGAKQAMLRTLQSGPRAEEIQLARTSVEKVEERVTYARAQLERLEPLFGKKLLSRKA